MVSFSQKTNKQKKNDSLSPKVKKPSETDFFTQDAH